MADVTPLDTTTSCGVDVETHVAQIIAVLAHNGISLGCREVYKALQVIAASTKLVFGHDSGDFDPMPLANEFYTRTTEVITQWKAEQAQAALHAAQRTDYNGQPSDDAVPILAPGSDAKN